MCRLGLLVILPGLASAQHRVSLNWTASTSADVAGYRVYRGTTAGGPYVLLNSSPVVGVSYEDSTVQNGQTYYYVATAVDNSNQESVYSNEAQAVVPRANPQPLTVTNNASNQPGPIAPGELITIKGMLLGPATPISYSIDAQGSVSAAMAGVRVLFDGLPGTMIYASAMQLNVTVPWEIAGRVTTNIVVENDGVQS